MSSLSMREQFATTASDLLEEDSSVAVVLADISAAMFTRAAGRHPRRVVNVGIREQLLVNVGAGMALTGMRPIMHTFATFLIERAFEQVKLGFTHQGVAGVLVSAGASYDVSRGGRSHQASGDVALLDTLPSWTVHVPGHPTEVNTLLRSAVISEGPVYLRTSTQQNTKARPVDRHGQMTLVRQGSGGTVVAVGPMLDPVLAATEGIDVTVLLRLHRAPVRRSNPGFHTRCAERCPSRALPCRDVSPMRGRRPRTPPPPSPHPRSATGRTAPLRDTRAARIAIRTRTREDPPRSANLP